MPVVGVDGGLLDARGREVVLGGRGAVLLLVVAVVAAPAAVPLFGGSVVLGAGGRPVALLVDCGAA